MATTTPFGLLQTRLADLSFERKRSFRQGAAGAYHVYVNPTGKTVIVYENDRGGFEWYRPGAASQWLEDNWAALKAYAEGEDTSARVKARWETLSHLLDDEDAENDDVRDAALDLRDALSALYGGSAT